MDAFVDDLDTQALLEHWLAVEEAIRDGARHRLPRGKVALLSLEALAMRPRPILRGLLAWILRGDGEGEEAHAGAVFDADAPAESDAPPEYTDSAAGDGSTDGAGALWLELPAATEWLRSVRTAPNAHYARAYAAQLASNEQARALHEALADTFEERVRAVSGYALRDASSYGKPPARPAVWWRHWHGGTE